MPRAPLPDNEAERLAELRALNLLDTEPEEAYDDITFLATQITDTPIALVTLVDADRQWFKSMIGLEVRETDRDAAFCAHAILEPEDMLVVPDARLDERFVDNPLVMGAPRIRFYAGVPLVTDSGAALGTLCVIDDQPRDLSEDQRRGLMALARQVMAQLDLRRHVAELKGTVAERRAYEAMLERNQRQLEDSLASVTAQSKTDPLTGLHNRRALVDRLQEELARAAHFGMPLSMVMIDVDRFKEYNDTHGHLAGDRALVSLAELIRGQCRVPDSAARYGGEEFAVVLPNTTAAGGMVLAERFRRAVEEAAWEGHPLTISVGVATMTGATADELIDAADQALYQAKAEGRNRVAVAAALD